MQRSKSPKRGCKKAVKNCSVGRNQHRWVEGGLTYGERLCTLVKRRRQDKVEQTRASFWLTDQLLVRTFIRVDH